MAQARGQYYTKYNMGNSVYTCTHNVLTIRANTNNSITKLLFILVTLRVEISEVITSTLLMQVNQTGVYMDRFV